MAVMAMLIFDDKEVNVDQVVKMALIHDIGRKIKSFFLIKFLIICNLILIR